MTKRKVTREEAMSKMADIQKQLCLDDKEQIDFLISFYVERLTNKELEDELSIVERVEII